MAKFKSLQKEALVAGPQAVFTPSTAFRGISMSYFTTLRQETPDIFKIFGPLLISQYAQIANGIIDTAMAARLGTTELGGVAVGVAIWTPVYMFVIGPALQCADSRGAEPRSGRPERHGRPRASGGLDGSPSGRCRLLYHCPACIVRNVVRRRCGTHAFRPRIYMVGGLGLSAGRHGGRPALFLRGAEHRVPRYSHGRDHRVMQYSPQLRPHVRQSGRSRAGHSGVRPCHRHIHGDFF